MKLSFVIKTKRNRYDITVKEKCDAMSLVLYVVDLP